MHDLAPGRLELPARGGAEVRVLRQRHRMLVDPVAVEEDAPSAAVRRRRLCLRGCRAGTRPRESRPARRRPASLTPLPLPRSLTLATARCLLRRRRGLRGRYRNRRGRSASESAGHWSRPSRPWPSGRPTRVTRRCFLSTTGCSSTDSHPAAGVVSTAATPSPRSSRIVSVSVLLLATGSDGHLGVGDSFRIHDIVHDERIRVLRRRSPVRPALTPRMPPGTA